MTTAIFGDRYLRPGWDAPAIDHWDATKSDTVNETQQFRGVFVGTAGNIAIVSADGTVCLYKNIANGSFLPVSGKRINNTNTTAADIVLLK